MAGKYTSKKKKEQQKIYASARDTAYERITGRTGNGQPQKQLSTFEAAQQQAYNNVLSNYDQYKQAIAERQRQQRVLSQYQMNRMQPAGWMNGGPEAQLQMGLQRMQQAKEQAQRQPGFQDWSAASNLLDPNSKVNALISQRPQEEQDYWQGVRQDIGKAISKGKGNDRASQLLRPLTIEERMRQKQERMESLGRVAQGQPINPLQNPRQYAQEVYDVRSGGTYTGNDPLFMNPEQLEAWKKKNQRGLEQTQRTDEQQAILRGRTMEAGEQHEVYRQLNQRGLPVEFNRGKMSLPEADQWESLPDEYFIKRRPEEYYRDDNAKYEYDKMMYDAIHGRGAYDAIALNDDATDEEIDALDAEVEHLWRQLEGGNFNVEEGEASADYFAKLNRENDTRTNGYQRNIDQADRYIGYLDRIAELEAGAPEGTYEYDPSKVNHNISLESGEADQLYYYANIDLSDEDLTDLQRYGNLRPEQFMTDAQRNTFNAYYENGQYAEATEYYKAMEPYLRQMKNEYRTLLEQRMYNNGWSIPMTLYRIASKPVEGVVGLGLTAAGLLGNEAALDTNSELWDISRTNQNIQNTSADAWARQAAEWFGGGDEGFAAQAGRFLNGVFFSMADNLTAFALSGGASKVSADAAQKLTQQAIQFIMSSEATAGTMFEQLEAGVDPTRAAIMSFGSGIIEAITEKYSLEQILDPDVRAVLGTKGAFMKYLGKASFAEGSEEIASDLLDTGLDFIMSAAYGDAPELIRNYEALIAEGMSEEEATRKVLGDYLSQLGSDGLAGALSGLLMSGSRGVQARGLDSYQTRSIGSTVVNRNVEEGMTAKEKSGEQYSNFMKLNDAAKMLQPGSEARRIAQEIEADVKKGGKVSMKKAGKLTRAIMNETNEQIGQVADAVLGDTLTQQLRDEGITQEDAARYSEVLKDAVETGKMTPEAMLILSQDERARGLWSEIVKSEDVQSARAAQKSVMDLITTPGERAAENIRENVAAKMAVARYVTEKDAEMQEALAAGEQRTGSPLEVVADGKIGNVTGFGLKEIKGENGTTWAVTAKVETADGTIEVDLNDVLSTNAKTAQVLQMVQAENGQSIGEHMTMQLLKIAQNTKDIAGAATDAISIAMDDLLGEKTKVTTLSKTEEQAMRAALEEDKKAADAEAAKNQKQLNPGKAKIVLNGVEYGSQKFAQELGKYGAQIRDEANYVAKLMKSIGMDVEFYYDNSEEGSARQGAFVGTQGIRLNLAGTFTSDGVHRSVVATAAHEATHWLRANAQEAYRQLQTYALKGLQNANVNVRNELRRIMDNYALYGEHLTMDKAAEEMTAMGCEEIFTNEQLVSDLQAEDPTLYGKVKQAVQHVMNLLRKVAGQNMATSSRRYAQKLRGTLDQMAKVWKITYEAAKGATETGTGTGEKLSVMQLTDGTKVAIEDENILDNKPDGMSMSDYIFDYLTERVGDSAIVEATGDAVYLGKDLPHEYISSEYTRDLRGRNNRNGNKKKLTIKNRTAGMLLDAIVAAENKTGPERAKHSNNKNARYGVYKFTTRIAFPIKDYTGNISNYKAYTAQLIVNYTGERNLELYDIIDINNDNLTGNQVMTESSDGSAKWIRHPSVANNNIQQSGNKNNTRNSFRDEDYADAVARGDWTAAENMLIEKMQQTEGITGYRAPHFYAGEHKDIARLIKSGDSDVINSIVDDMAQHVPENAVLVPMPPHEGKVTDSTDTKILAEALSKKTGAPVIVALESDYHPSRYQAKANGDRSVNAQTMGFRQVEEIPEGMMPVFIDNMVGGGQTAIAAKNAIGRGITLAYAQSSRSKTKGVKIASVTYDSDGNLIPLSQRMDPENPSWKYSIRDEDYMAAVERGDMETAQRMVDQKAEEAFANSKIRGKDGKLLKVFHGTNADFNVFDTSVSGGINGTAEGYGIYLSDSQDVTEHYGSRQIGAYLNMKRPAYGNRQTIRKGELTKLIKAASEYEARRIMEEEGYDSIQDALRDTWISGYVYTPGYSNINDAYTETADKILQFNKNDADIVLEIMSAMGIRDYEREMEFYHDVLTPTTGIDGFWQQWDNTETGEKANIFLAFDSNQIKEADPVTYDDDGNIIPLSERFNENEKDIRFSIRDDTDYDVRQWMETVPEWSLQTEAEKQLLSKYKSMQMKQRLDRERMRKIDSDLMKLEVQLTEERNGRIEAEETMENALESAGASVREGHWLQKDGKIIGKINADGTISLNKGVPESVYQDLRAAGFGFTNKKGIFRPAMSAPQNADGKPTITALLGKSEAQRQRDALLKRKQDLQETMDEQEVKLAEITKDEGFGRMMYQQRKVLDELESFGTQQELMDYVARMEKKAQEVAARIEENRKATEALEKGGIVDKFRKLLGTTSAAKAAEELKHAYHSTWTVRQIQNYLDPIILKMKTGADFEQDVEDLAGVLVMSDARNADMDEDLRALRGFVIKVGEGQMRELKAQGSSLREIRSKLAGTGIKVVEAKVKKDADGNVVSREVSTLENGLDDAIEEYGLGILGELGGEKDALGTFVEKVQKRIADATYGNNYAQRISEAMAVITGKAAGAAKGIYMPDDPKAQKQVRAMMNFVKNLSAETAEAQKTLADIAAQMGEMQKAGMAATNRATTLMRDVNVAIDYYQKIGKIAADEAKQKKQSAVIEQLKSKHAQEIVKNNEEWRALVQRDKDARAQLDENRKMTRQINTNLKRTWNLLKNPKGLQNIPEYMQGLAREVISKFVDNDLGRGARFIQATQKELAEWRRILDAWEAQNGKFDRTQLGAMDAENVKADVVLADLDKITDGMKQLNAWKIYGKNKLDALQQRGAIIEQIRDAVSEIYTAIRAEGEVQAGDRRVAVEDAAYEVAKGTGGKKYREWTGSMGQMMSWLHKAIVSGTMTPEYFFRTLGNQGLSDLWENYHWAENKNGLELKKAKDRLAQIAEEYGYKNWDMKQKIKLNLQSGEVEITLGQMMSLWATWQREKTLGPEMSSHLTHGGFYADVDLRDGLLGRATVEKRAHRVTEEDMDYVLTQLTVDQMNFIDAVVKFMSNDMSELGNAASMQAYGIKLYKESYYFPFQMWDGVKSRKSNDAGGAAAANDRAFHPSFSKSRQHGANNAVMIGDFMQVATDHIAGMINYATMGLANENLQKVLNAQTAEEYDTKRNTWALIEEAYGREAKKYLADLQMQLNGGAVKIDKTFYDKLISAFRKNAVAGSLSVALQQPLSYMRAAMMIDSRYLARAISPDMWKGSYKEMLAHSGVAVIKEMGRFDMNFGSSAREYLTPDGKEGKARAAWNWVADKSTMLPELMDRMTWTRMWSAVKAEQKAQHPEMDVKSDEFLDMCGKRFNDLMRRTQVYDSTLVKSANMRSQNPAMKMLTSFMAEPSLTLNVMADSFRMAIQGEKGGKTLAVKSSVIFLIGAVFQAAVKGAMGARRNPDDKKTWGENFWYRFWYNFIGEANPMQLVPGYDELITALKGGDISDDAMGTLSKLFKSVDKVGDLIGGKTDTWRGIEDSAGQIVQLFTRVPVKNLMRDMRATWNWIGTDPYAKREDSDAVLKYQFKDLFMNADNLLGVVNKKLGEAGWETSNKAYYQRIYQAKKEGREQDAADMIEYLLKGKGVKKEDSITSGVNSVAKNDKTQTPEQRLDFLMNNGGSQLGAYVAELYEKGEIDRAQAEQMYKEANPKAMDKDILEALDRVDYKKEGGEDESFSNYTRLEEAMDAGDAEQVQKEKEYLLSNGFKEEDINSKMKSIYTDRYKKGEIDRSDAERMLKKYHPEMDADDIFWTLDRIDYKKETGNDVSGSSSYYRLKDAINANKSTEIRDAVKMLLDHGYDKKKIKDWIGNKSTGFKTAYLEARGNEKVRIKNALIMAYKAIGINETEANEIINKWK